MTINQKYMTQNDCYKAGKKITPQGIMVHSTATPGVMAATWFDRWNKAGVEKCVHAFVDSKGVYQYLPWNHRAWHCGGTGNNTHISFELCEPSGFSYSGNKMVGYDPNTQQPYFDAVWSNAVELCAMLCEQYKLQAGQIICHSEANKMSIASAHADVMHWFPQHGRTMDMFRGAVDAALKGSVLPPVTTPPTSPSVDRPTLYRGSKGEDVRDMQKALLAKGYKLPKYGADGDFGEETQTALLAFIADKKLAECDERIWTALTNEK